MGTDNSFAEDLLKKRLSELKDKFENASPPTTEECPLGGPMRDLGILFCEVELHRIKKSRGNGGAGADSAAGDSPENPSKAPDIASVLAALAARAPWAVTTGFGIWVVAKWQGVL
jgi:hypothetical protein